MSEKSVATQFKKGNKLGKGRPEGSLNLFTMVRNSFVDHYNKSGHEVWETIKQKHPAKYGDLAYKFAALDVDKEKRATTISIQQNNFAAEAQEHNAAWNMLLDIVRTDSSVRRAIVEAEEAIIEEDDGEQPA